MLLKFKNSKKKTFCDVTSMNSVLEMVIGDVDEGKEDVIHRNDAVPENRLFKRRRSREKVIEDQSK